MVYEVLTSKWAQILRDRLQILILISSESEWINYLLVILKHHKTFGFLIISKEIEVN